MTPAFVEAYRCDRAAYYLLWERLHGNTYGWAVHHGNQVVGTLDGYPIDTPARTSRDAVPWAADLTGIPADHWVQQPPRSGAFHTHE